MLKHHYTKWAIIEGLYKGRDVDIKRKDKKKPIFYNRTFVPKHLQDTNTE